MATKGVSDGQVSTQSSSLIFPDGVPESLQTVQRNRVASQDSGPQQNKPCFILSTDNAWISGKNGNMIRSTSFSSCVCIGGTVYATCSNVDGFVYMYETASSKWNGIVRSDIGSFGLGKIGDKLVRIGGQNLFNGNVTGEVKWLSQNGWDGSEMPPNMPTSRYWPAVACNERYVAVCGGLTENGVSNCVEILKINTTDWFQVQSLPFSGERMSATLDSNHLYVANSYTVYTCSSQSSEDEQVACAELKSLFDEEHHGAVYNISSSIPQESVVRSFNNAPEGQSKWFTITFEKVGQEKFCPILFNLYSCIIAMNGTSLYAYHPDYNKFIATVDLCKHRVSSDCTVLLYGSAVGVLPEYKIMVVGGENKDGVPQTETKTLSIEKKVACSS